MRAMPSEHRDDQGRVWVPDPTGRYPYRAQLNGGWTNFVADTPGGPVGVDVDGGRQLRTGATPPAPGRRVEDLGRSGLSTLLGVLGAISVIGGIILIIAGLADQSGYDSNGTAYVVLGGTAAIQGLLLIGFSQALGYLRATALLLSEAVDRD